VVILLLYLLATKSYKLNIGKNRNFKSLYNSDSVTAFTCQKKATDIGKDIKIKTLYNSNSVTAFTCHKKLQISARIESQKRYTIVIVTVFTCHKKLQYWQGQKV